MENINILKEHISSLNTKKQAISTHSLLITKHKDYLQKIYAERINACDTILFEMVTLHNEKEIYLELQEKYNNSLKIITELTLQKKHFNKRT